MVEIRSAGRAVLVLMLVAGGAPAVWSQNDAEDLAEISLENLMTMQVMSVSRQEEELRKATAAVYVITQEDIRRSGMTDLAELLRMVPGVNVAQINNSNWAVTARGFNAQYAKKLLVLVDGRTVYDNASSGVYWHLQNLILEDIDRIEVIRGPGATMWGANAVNGVISITTKRAENTQGGLFTANAGMGRPGEGAFRFGSAIGKNAFYRAFARQTTRSSASTQSGDNGGDSWNMTSSGFRLDWDPSQSNSLTVEGEAYRMAAGGREKMLMSLSPASYATAGLSSGTGGHVLARWNHSWADSSNLTVQFYADDRAKGGYHPVDTDGIDFDLQHAFDLGSRNNIIWGIGHHRGWDDFENTLEFSVYPNAAKTSQTSVFLQDEFTAVRDRLYFTAGSKFEKSSLTGYNFQPTLRALWIPTTRQSVWAGVSRAIRTASRIERGMNKNVAVFNAGSLPGVVSIRGQQSARSEELIAYEAGYRYQANRRLWLDVTTFYNVYDHLSILAPGASFFEREPAPAHIVSPTFFDNSIGGITYGGEAAASYRIHDSLELKGSYSMLRMRLNESPTSGGSAKDTEGQSPRNQIYLGSFLRLPKSLELSSHVYFVGALPSFQVPGYSRIDLNLGWRGLENLEFNLVGQNLLGSHMEIDEQPSPSNTVGRSIQGRITWRF